MKQHKQQLINTNNTEEILEFIKTARTLKRQIRLMSGISLEHNEESMVRTALTDLKSEFAMFSV